VRYLPKVAFFTLRVYGSPVSGHPEMCIGPVKWGPSRVGRAALRWLAAYEKKYAGILYGHKCNCV